MKQKSDSWELWAKRLARLAESGITTAEYAAELGVSTDALQRWRHRLAQGRQAPRQADALPERRCANRQCGRVFVPPRPNAVYCCPLCRAAVAKQRYLERRSVAGASS
jgi:hypothetical protein